MLLIAATANVCAEQVNYRGISFELPTTLESARKLVADKITPALRRQSLERLVAGHEARYEETVDIIVPANMEEKAAMTIWLEPVKADDVSDQEYMDDVFEAMLRIASNLDDPAPQTRNIVDQSSSYGFYRMDISNAYGTAGVQASFLAKRIDERYLMILIMAADESFLDSCDELLASLRLAKASSN